MFPKHPCAFLLIFSQYLGMRPGYGNIFTLLSLYIDFHSNYSKYPPYGKTLICKLELKFYFFSSSTINGLSNLIWLKLFKANFVLRRPGLVRTESIKIGAHYMQKTNQSTALSLRQWHFENHLKN